jgi:hypothetical protein
VRVVKRLNEGIVFIPGMAKAGTTTVADFIFANLEVEQRIKEPGFCYTDSVGESFVIRFGLIFKKKFKFGGYLKLIQSNGLTVDASPHYLHDSQFSHFIRTLRLLKKSGKCCKVIVCLRDPIRRIVSQYKHHKRDVVEPLDLSDLIYNQRYNTWTRGIDSLWLGYDYIGNSKFVRQIEILKGLLDDTELLLIDLEYMSTSAVERKIVSFLGMVNVISPLRQANRSGPSDSLGARALFIWSGLMGLLATKLFSDYPALLHVLRGVREKVLSLVEIRGDQPTLGADDDAHLREVFSDELNFLAEFRKSDNVE